MHSIKVTDRGIRVNKQPLKPNKIPIGVVTILPGIQIELDTDFMEFVENLQQTSRPISFELRVKNASRELEVWSAVRYETGKVGENRVCDFTVIKGKVKSVQFNQELAYNTAFIKYERLSILHKLTLGKSDSKGLCSKGMTTLNRLLGIDMEDLAIKEFSNGIEYKIPKYKTNYTFFKDKHGYMNLLSIGSYAQSE